MIIDIHSHLPRPFRKAANVEELIPGVETMIAAAQRAGVDKQVILGLNYGDDSNRILGELVARFPNDLIGFARGSYLDPDCPAVIERAVKEYGLKGVKLHEELPYFTLTGLLGAHALYDKAAELGVPVLIHTWHQEEGLDHVLHEINDGHFPMLILDQLGTRHPDTIFILAHAGGFVVKAAQAAQPYPNIGLDVCGFDPERGITEKAVEILGAERVYWGSDAPGRSFAAQLTKVKYADISERDKALVMGGNAARVLGLGR